MAREAARARRRARADRRSTLAVRRAHRPVRIRQVAGDPRARGPRLLLRRQPAGHAAADAGGADAARRQRDRARGRRRRRARRARCSTEFPAIFRRAARRCASLNPVLIFLEAAEPALVRRFSETRRPHPLAPDRSAIEGIREERDAHARRSASWPTTSSTRRSMTVHELRHVVHGRRERARARHAAGRDDPELRVQARHPGRLGPAVRRPVPAEPALRADAAAAHRPRPRGRAFLERSDATHEFLRPHAEPAASS